MDIKDFLDLPEEIRNHLLWIETQRRDIRKTVEVITKERKELDYKEMNNQIRCEHWFADKTYKAHENEFGNFTGGGVYHYHCEDCGKRWSEEKK
jgi:hypothetical protein